MFLPTVQGLGWTEYPALLILESVIFLAFPEKEFHWDTELTKELKGENELILSLAVFFISFY